MASQGVLRPIAPAPDPDSEERSLLPIENPPRFCGDLPALPVRDPPAGVLLPPDPDGFLYV